MTFGAKGSVALVTGGTRGIGRAVSLALAAAGVDTVILNYLQDEASAASTQRELESRSARSDLVKANLASPDEIDRLFATVAASHPRLDYFVHCAALGAFKPLLDTRPNQWDLTMNINARGFLLCAQHAARLMQGGAMVAVSSLGSTRAIPNYGAMGPTKAALEAVVRQLAVELATRGIRVNAVTGGLVDTISIQKFPDAEKRREESIRRTPAGRIGTAEEIADAILFLLSPAARWIYGHTLVADGGFCLL
ncbi:MAG: fabL [Verrucomicrobia bacterium]|nr:fabL [Verrucomicrobiota bacterium]